MRKVALLLVAVAAVVLLRTMVVTTYVVESHSMEPTVGSGSLVLVDRLTYRISPIRRDQLVVFRSEGRLALKRVVGVAGDVVAMRDGVLHVNGRARSESYVDLASVDGTYTGRVVVPRNSLYVLGDRREGSIDSRRYGPVPLSAVRGRVLAHW